VTTRPDYLSARDALAALDVKAQTLYAYVSRGWIRSVSQAGTRERLYSREDVEKVRMRSVARAGHGPAAATAMRWGEPVIHSSITEITPEGPRYRGRLATELARAGLPFEVTADFLWTGVWDESTRAWPVARAPAAFNAVADELAQRFPGTRFRQMLAFLVQSLAAAQEGNPEAKLGSTVLAARQLLQVLAGAFGYLRDVRFVAPAGDERIAQTLARALGAKLDATALAAIDAVLTMSADHELAPSTFAARIAASTGANLHACIISGIAAFDGALTGIGADQTEDLVRGARTTLELRRRFRQLREQGRQPPGFNHPLYPRGDPRAQLLLELARRAKRAPPEAVALLEFVAEAERDFQVYPGLPVGLVAVALAYGLPARSAGAIFLLGRISGWVAHVQEQRLAGFLLRPRAKYVP
jgi:citrate synthase